jgi:hypothetical protein
MGNGFHSESEESERGGNTTSSTPVYDSSTSTSDFIKATIWSNRLLETLQDHYMPCILDLVIHAIWSDTFENGFIFLHCKQLRFSYFLEIVVYLGTSCTICRASKENVRPGWSTSATSIPTRSSFVWFILISAQFRMKVPPNTEENLTILQSVISDNSIEKFHVDTKGYLIYQWER